MTKSITLKKYNGRIIDIADEMTRYFLSMKDKGFQAKWMSEYLVGFYHDRQNISFEFSDNKDSTYLVSFADNIEFINPFTVETKEKYINNVGIFIPGKEYFWKVKDIKTNEESEIDSFKILDVFPRWISAGTVYNMRDLGGMETIDNKRVKYSLIYRGGQLSLDNEWEKSYMNDYSFKVFDYLGIKSEIELRGGYSHEFSQMGKDKNNYYVNGIGYEQIFAMNDEQKEGYRNIFKYLSDINNYPFYFHCSWGADRTGVLAFLISGVLGVPYDALCEDYELTSLTGSGRRSRITFPWKDMYPTLVKEYGEDKSFKDVLTEYLTKYVGVSKENIDSLREIMLEDKKNFGDTHIVTYMVDGKKYIESSVFDGGQIGLIEPGIFSDKYLECWMMNGKRYDETLPVHSDLVLDAKLIPIEFEEYDTISLKDIGLGDSYDLSKPGDFKYEGKAKNGARVFRFDYKIESPDSKFDDGVHIEIGTLWDYKAHIWFQNEFFQFLYIRKDMLFISFYNKLAYSNTFRIEVGVLIPKNGKYKGKKMFFYKINGKVITMVETQVDLSVKSIGLAGTKGILYNV